MSTSSSFGKTKCTYCHEAGKDHTFAMIRVSKKVSQLLIWCEECEKEYRAIFNKQSPSEPAQFPSEGL